MIERDNGGGQMFPMVITDRTTIAEGVAVLE